MVHRIISMSLLALAVTALPTSIALALGFQLGETKDELKLDYSVVVRDHGTGRVTILFALNNPGRLNPLTSIDLSIPSTEKHASGGFMSDLSLSLATRKIDEKQVASIHLKRDFAERAEIQLKTAGLDGKVEPLTWYYHSIPIARYMDTKGPRQEQP